MGLILHAAVKETLLSLTDLLRAVDGNVFCATTDLLDAVTDVEAMDRDLLAMVPVAVVLIGSVEVRLRF